MEDVITNINIINQQKNVINWTNHWFLESMANIHLLSMLLVKPTFGGVHPGFKRCSH